MKGNSSDRQDVSRRAYKSRMESEHIVRKTNRTQIQDEDKTQRTSSGNENESAHGDRKRERETEPVEAVIRLWG